MEPPRSRPPPELEFGGPWGVGALTLLLPLGLVGVVSVSLGEGEGWGTPALALPTPLTVTFVLAWVGAHGLGSCWRPPRTPTDIPGPLRDLGWLLVLGGTLGGALALGVPLPPLCRFLPPLAAASSSVAFGLGLVLLVRRRWRRGGNGNPVYEFFMGGELVSPLEPPECVHWERVGLCAWLLVLAAALGEQQRLWGSPSLPLVLVAAAQGVPALWRLRCWGCGSSMVPPPRRASSATTPETPEWLVSPQSPQPRGRCCWQGAGGGSCDGPMTSGSC